LPVEATVILKGVHRTERLMANGVCPHRCTAVLNTNIISTNRARMQVFSVIQREKSLR
jgi:hypothetical protein